MGITLESVLNCQVPTLWNLSNQILYNLCSENFDHSDSEKIIAKTLLIGRSYAAAVERRTKDYVNPKSISDDFYLRTIPDCFKQMNLDPYLEKLLDTKLIEATVDGILQTHGHLTRNLKTITGLDKRSFSSKYLHFHLPELFFIYDSRADKAISSLKIKTNFDKVTASEDFVYTDFFLKCMALRHQITSEFEVVLTPRQLDNLLMSIANDNLSFKRLGAQSIE